MGTRPGRRYEITTEILSALHAALRVRRQSVPWLANEVPADRTLIQRLMRAEIRSSALLPRICEVLDVPFDAVNGALLDRGTVSVSLVPVVGYVGAGDLYYPDAESGPWRGFDWVERPPGAEDDLAAVIVRGSSMEPVYRNGYVLYFRRSIIGVDETECLGDDCVVQIDGGPAYIKHLARGSRPGLYTLESWGGADPICDVRLEWASRILYVARKRR